MDSAALQGPLADDIGAFGGVSGPVDFFASMAHYRSHLEPIWWALPEDLRGSWRGHPTDGTAGVVVTASARDSMACGAGHVVLVEHGAGQAYPVENPSYSGGSKRDNVTLFLCPNEVSADRNRSAYPGAVVDVVGSPRLDALIAAAEEPSGDGVALTHHWDCSLCPETRWAQPHFWPAYPDVVKRFDVIGHGHPRYRFVFGNLWKRLGIEHLERFEDVMGRARLLVADNTSAMYEWAALGRPVLVLNSPGYRRDVEAWPRFWACADVGIQVDRPEVLCDAITMALEDPPAVTERRRAVVDEVFPHRDGRAAERAAHAIERLARAVGSAA